MNRPLPPERSSLIVILFVLATIGAGLLALWLDANPIATVLMVGVVLTIAFMDE